MPDTQYTVSARPFRPQRGPRFAAAAAAVFIAVALVKPWATPATDPRAGDPSPVANTRVLASLAARVPDPSAGPNTMPCLAGAEAQVVTVERSAGREIRSWIAVVDEVASDASRLRAPAISVFSTDVVGIGVCGPDSIGSAGRTPGPSGGPPIRDPQAASMITVVVVAGSSGSSGAVERRVVGVGSPLAGQDVGTDFARLYGPPAEARGTTEPSAPASSVTPPPTATARPDASTASTAAPHVSPTTQPAPRGEPAWALGSYAIAFRYRADGPSIVRWVRIDIRPGTPAAP